MLPMENANKTPQATAEDFDLMRATMLDVAQALYACGIKRIPVKAFVLQVACDPAGEVVARGLEVFELSNVAGPLQAKLEVASALMRKAMERSDLLVSGVMFDEPEGAQQRILTMAVLSREELQQQFRLAGAVEDGYRLIPLE